MLYLFLVRNTNFIIMLAHLSISILSYMTTSKGEEEDLGEISCLGGMICHEKNFGL